MVKFYGNPTVYSRVPINAKLFRGVRGIIGFKVPFVDGSSTGHFTLWDGFKLLYGGGDEDYFKIATEAALWEAGTTRTCVPDV